MNVCILTAQHGSDLEREHRTAIFISTCGNSAGYFPMHLSHREPNEKYNTAMRRADL